MGLFTISCNSQDNNVAVQKESVHQFVLTDLNGDTFNMSSLKGKKVMIVNTASKCGLTYQYEILEKMYNSYKSDNFVIVGFPANNFLWQEPGSNEEIAKFCLKNYGVTFPMMEKISVKGSDMHPLYKFLTNKQKLENNPRLWTVFSNIKKMSKEKKKQIQNDSKNFLIQITKT